MKTQEGTIGYTEALALVFALTATKAYLQFPTFLIQQTATAGWYTPLLSAAIALVAFLPAVALMRRFPGEGLGSIAEKSAGWFGVLVALGVAVYFFVAGTLTLRNITETFIVAILPETPPSVLTAGLLLCAAAASYRGVETMGRTALVLLPLGILAIGAVIIFNITRVNWSWLYPLWGHGIPDTAVQGALLTGGFAEVLAIVALGYAFRTPDLAARAGRNGILLAAGVLTGVTLVFLLTFGWQGAGEQPFPAYILAQNIYLGRFFQRVESFLVLIWFFTAAVMISAVFHAVIAIVTDVLHLPVHRPLVFPLVILWFSASLLPPDFVRLLDLQFWVRTWAGWMAFLAPPLLLLIAVVRRKRGGQPDVAQG